MPETKQLEHKTVKAAATTTDQGQFTAIAAAYTVDRVRDRIVPGAFAKTIAAWQESGKNIPLHWDHSGSAEDIIGWVDPAAMEERDEGLFVAGQLDLKSSATAREAWRSMKNNSVALSFGYLAKGEKADDGITDLTEIDLFEVSIVSAPANPSTRLLSLKAMKALRDVESVQAYLDDNFPGHKIVSTAVEDGDDKESEGAKSAPQDPLVSKAWDLIVGTPKPHPETTPEPEPEPLDAATVQSEAWTRILQ